MISADLESTEMMFCCASCGIAEGGDIKLKLKECTDCDLVKYCGDKCREKHREQHSEECNKRKAELLHDKELFTQPDETHHGECPLCFLPMPIDPQKSIFWSCCSEIICKGCDYANDMSGGGDRCPFCREPVANREENRKKLMKRIKANDPAALTEMGQKCYDKGDYDGALKYSIKAAEFGDMDAHHRLGFMYYKGEWCQKDEEKAMYHWEKAAIGGHSEARHNLAAIEEKRGNNERAVKHFIISANLGLKVSMKSLWKHYSVGHITKEDLDATLRTHQAALDAMKSEQRDAAESVQQNRCSS